MLDTPKSFSIAAPNSKDSEMMVLGCMLTSINALNIASDSLEDSDFYYTEHKIIFPILKAANKHNKPADVHLVCEELRRQEKLNEIGGAAYITALAQYAGTSAYIEEYVEILKAHSSRRSLINFGKQVIENAVKNDSPDCLILESQEFLKQIEKHRNPKDKFPIKFIDQLDKNFLLEEPSPKPMILDYVNEQGVRTGFLPKGIVANLVGAGGVGKTHLLAQLAVAVATGTPFVDAFTTTKHCGAYNSGNVFLGMGENQYDDIHRILFKASKKIRENKLELSRASEQIAVFSFCGQQAAFLQEKKPSLYFRQLKARLEDMAPPSGWTLILLDPVSRLLGADAESDNAAATQFVALLEELTIDLPGNPTVLFAHHVNKESMKANKQSNSQNQTQAASRGASALTDGVRWQSNFFKSGDNELVILQMTKTNFTAFAPQISLTKDTEGYLNKSLLNGSFENNKAKKNYFSEEYE